MRWTLTWTTSLFALALAAGVPEVAAAGFDVETEFLTGPVIECETETNPIGRQECVSVTVEVRFGNVGSERSPRRRVALNMYRGSRASGYATRFGGPGGTANLPELAPGESVTLSWTARRVQLGQYTFRPHYTPSLEDRNNDNHQVSQTVTIEGEP